MTKRKTNQDNRKKTKANGLGTIWKRDNGKWSWQVTLGYTPNGKRIARSGTEIDKTKAGKALFAAIAAHEKGLLAPPGKITLAEFVDLWLARQTNLATTTQTSYRQELALVLKHLGHFNMRDVRRHHIRDTLSTISQSTMERGLGTGKPISSRTLSHIRTRLRAVFRDAVSDGLMAVNPTDNVKRVKTLRTEHPGVALDFDQVARLRELGETLYCIGACRLWNAIFTAVSIGLRRGEVMGLRWCDLNLETGLLQVRQNLTTPGGKLVMRPPKTESGVRDVLIPASLKAALERQKSFQIAEFKAYNIQFREDGPVFATSLGTYTHPDNLNRALKEILAWSDPEAVPRVKKAQKTTMAVSSNLEHGAESISHGGVTPQRRKKKPALRLNLERKMKAIRLEHRAALEAVIRSGEPLPAISPHDLRHTAGTLMIRRGMPFEVVSKILGHARVSITLDVYRHVLESERRTHVVDLFEMPVPNRVQAAVLN